MASANVFSQFAQPVKSVQDYNDERDAREVSRLALEDKRRQNALAAAAFQQQTADRNALQQFLADRQIGSAVYYPVPLHLQKCFAALGCEEGSLPVTEQVCREVLSLPVYPELTAQEQGRVIDAIETFCKSKIRAVA